MKCPLTYKEKVSYYQGRDYGIEDCLKERCAWWDDKFQQCLFFTATEQLFRIANILSDIRDKMPHEEQFRK